MMARCRILQERQYKTDNSLVNEELKTNCQLSTAWAFIKDFDKKKDGRDAVLACTKQFEGTADNAVLKAKAYEEISRARYAQEGKSGMRCCLNVENLSQKARR
jgi:hypothetical protein